MNTQAEQKPEARKKIKSTEPFLIASWEEPGSPWVTFRFVNNNARPRVTSLNHLYTELRKALIALSGDRTWSVRYASQIRQENFPFLHSSHSLHILLDPLAPLRDPIRELLKDGYLCWQLHPSQSYYFKSLEEAEAIRQRDRMIRTAVPSAIKPMVVPSQPLGDSNGRND